jgi:hypothetical protein
MQILSIGEAEMQFGISLQMVLGANHWKSHVATFRLPLDPGRLNALSRDISLNVNTVSGTLLIIKQTGVFESSENMYLVETFRRAFEEARSIKEAPVHAFTPEDHANCWSMISLAMFNFWDFDLLSGDHQILLHSSHDECLDICCRKGEDLERLRSRMQYLNVQEVPRLNTSKLT